jgi:hypothetical protein
MIPLLLHVPTMDMTALYMMASAKNRCLKINILKWNMACMHQIVSSVAFGYQICFKYILCYHAQKRCSAKIKDVHFSTFKVVIVEQTLLNNTMKY